VTVADIAPVTYAIRFDVVPEQRERFLALLTGVLDAMRAEPEFCDATLHADPEDANRFLLVETWSSHQNVIDVQINKPYRAAYHAALPELLRTPRDVTVWRPI